MPADTRSRSRRVGRGGNDERARRAEEAHQAAYELAQAVRQRAHSAKDAEWGALAEHSRRRAEVLLVAPALVGVVVALIGIVILPLVFAGAALLVLWLGLAVATWAGASKTAAGAVGGRTPQEAVSSGTVGAVGAERFEDLTAQVCAMLGLPVPTLRVVHDPSPNALSLGMRPELVTLVVTSGLLELLERIELEAVIAHELAHVKRYDTLVVTLQLTVIGRLVTGLAGGKGRSWLEGPDRETLADIAGVGVTRYPPGMISALERIAAAGSSRPATLPTAVLDRTARYWLVPLSVGDADFSATDRVDLLREL